jgi:hypothetical protein
MIKELKDIIGCTGYDDRERFDDDAQNLQCLAGTAPARPTGRDDR